MKKHTFLALKTLLFVAIFFLSFISISAQALDDPRVFNAEFYLNKYPDLRKAFGTNADQARNHWLTYGIREGRQAIKELAPVYYLARYPDLQAAFGKTNYEDAIRHWINWGINENREGASNKFFFIDEETKTGGAYNPNAGPDAWIYTASSNWMSYLPDDTKLKDISMPGTHDSGARFGGAGPETQSWTITQQLNSGIRFLDIRCRRTKTSFAIHHGAFFQHQMFGNIMDEIVDFFKDHPSEAIIMNVQEEYSAEEGSETFQDIWNSYAATYASILYSGGNNPRATLRNARGKVYVISNQISGSQGISWESVDAQQRYKVYWFAHYETQDDNWATLPSKKLEINNYIDKAASSDGWILNSLSGAYGMIPSDVARATNNSAYEYIGKKSGKRKLGVIVMDFPGEQLIYRIIKANFEFSRENCVPVLKSSEFYLENSNGNFVTKWYSGNEYYYPQYGNGNDAEPLFFGGKGDALLTGQPILIKTGNTGSMTASWQSSNELTAFGNGVGYWNYGAGNDKANWTLEQVSAYGNQVCFDDVVRIKNISYGQYLYPYPGKSYLWTKSAADEDTKWVIRRR